MKMDDTISRQAAIQWVKANCNPYGKPTLDYESGIRVMEHLKRMSSAQPEILACGEGELNVPGTNVGDMISRQAAIDAVCMEWCGVKHQDCKHPFDAEKDDYFWCDGCETALRTLPDLPSAEPEKVCIARINLSEEQVREAVERAKNEIVQVLPSSQPERKRGKWIEVNDAYNRISGRCSACGWEAHMYEDDVVGMPFCPSCGADMRGGETGCD